MMAGHPNLVESIHGTPMLTPPPTRTTRYASRRQFANLSIPTVFPRAEGILAEWNLTPDSSAMPPDAVEFIVLQKL
jgi:hypothetical protein